MAFVSFAQNFEDVILRRALINFGPGFYIDIGACDPVIDSTTKVFYDDGWRGINIEPMKKAYDRICKDRTRDINLNIAIDAQNGIKTFYSIDDGNGLSTSVKEYADDYISNGKMVDTVEIETKTLAFVCKTFVNEEIKFLKIDVEGSEQSVLEGADFTNYRPWIILVESTKPNSTIMVHRNWEHILFKSDYTFVYYDGLNRFYIANEKLELLQHYFNSPPNWFDHFELNSNRLILQELNALKREVNIIAGMGINYSGILHSSEHTEVNENTLSIIKNNIESLIANCARLKDKNDKNDLELDFYNQEIYENAKHISFISKERNELQHKINVLALQNMAFLRSTSWRITKPVRVIARIIKKLGLLND